MGDALHVAVAAASRQQTKFTADGHAKSLLRTRAAAINLKTFFFPRGKEKHTLLAGPHCVVW